MDCVEGEERLCGGRGEIVWRERRDCVEGEKRLCGGRGEIVWMVRGKVRDCVEGEEKLWIEFLHAVGRGAVRDWVMSAGVEGMD